jgi:ribosomal protein L27
MFNAKIKHWLTFKRCASLIILAGLITMRLTGTLYAQSVTQGYGTDDTLQRGMVVGITEDDATKVTPINVDQIDRILGVVVAANDSPITLSGEDEKVFVATVGRYDVLVSDQEGEIKIADYVTVSSLNGVGMLATFEQSQVVGRAVTNFNGKDGVIGSSTLKDTKGNERKVNIGRVQIDVGISRNPLAKSAAVTPEWLGSVGQAIAGKSLSPARLYISAAIFFIGAFIAGAILYAGIRSSIIAIGRNPLSKRSILRGLLQVIFTSLIVFIISVVGVYLLLRA